MAFFLTWRLRTSCILVICLPPDKRSTIWLIYKWYMFFVCHKLMFDYLLEIVYPDHVCSFKYINTYYIIWFDHCYIWWKSYWYRIWQINSVVIKKKRVSLGNFYFFRHGELLCEPSLCKAIDNLLFYSRNAWIYQFIHLKY